MLFRSENSGGAEPWEWLWDCWDVSASGFGCTSLRLDPIVVGREPGDGVWGTGGASKNARGETVGWA